MYRSLTPLFVLYGSVIFVLITRDSNVQRNKESTSAVLVDKVGSTTKLVVKTTKPVVSTTEIVVDTTAPTLIDSVTTSIRLTTYSTTTVVASSTVKEIPVETTEIADNSLPSQIDRDLEQELADILESHKKNRTRERESAPTVPSVIEPTPKIKRKPTSLGDDLLEKLKEIAEAAEDN
jgi:hypothetical protein